MFRYIVLLIALISLSTDNSEAQNYKVTEWANEWEAATKEIARKAISKKTGARGLRSILENILLKTMFELPSLDNVEEVIVDSGAAKGASQPMIVHSKNSPSKSKTSKTSAA